MGQFLHGSAKTTHVIRAELQRSKAPVAELARRYGINEKTVRKWRSRTDIIDAPMGPKERKSTVLSELEEAAIVSLRVQAREFGYAAFDDRRHYLYEAAGCLLTTVTTPSPLAELGFEVGQTIGSQARPNAGRPQAGGVVA